MIRIKIQTGGMRVAVCGMRGALDNGGGAEMLGYGETETTAERYGSRGRGTAADRYWGQSSGRGSIHDKKK